MLRDTRSEEEGAQDRERYADQRAAGVRDHIGHGGRTIRQGEALGGLDGEGHCRAQGERQRPEAQRHTDSIKPSNAFRVLAHALELYAHLTREPINFSADDTRTCARARPSRTIALKR